MSGQQYRIWIPVGMVLLGLAIAVGGLYGLTYKVFEEAPVEGEDFLILFEKIGEPDMVYTATFSGVARSEKGDLFFTYDRSAAQGGPKACPT